MVENQTSYVIQLFRSNGGGEYANNQLTAYFSQKGIVHEFTSPYAHEYNGVPERFNRTLQNMVRPWLADFNGLHKRFWAEAYAAAVYTKNRLPDSSLQDITPFEAFYRKKPSISHLQPFSRKCFIHIPEERRLPGSKLLLRAEEGIFLGYTDTPSIYKVHILARSHTFIVSALDVKFESVTADSRSIMEVTPTEVTTPEVTTITSISFARPITRSMTDSQQSLKPQQPLQQPQPSQTTAVIIPPSMPDSHCNQYIYLDDDHDEQVIISLDKYNDVKTHFDTEQEPTSYNQAVNGPYSDLWKEGIQQELDALHSNNTWSVVPIPVGQNIIGSKWVFKLKHDAD